MGMMAFSKLNKLMPMRKAKTGGTRISVAAAEMPEGYCAYVIGDIHGRNDLLVPLLANIAADAVKRSALNTHLIFLGDYVDRGPASAAVIDTILDLDLPQMNIVTLNGNHEASMLTFLDDPLKGKRWLHFGGDATVQSYGIDISVGELTSEDIVSVREKLQKALPDRHRAFLEGLVESYTLGDYFFAHAGIDPTVALSAQKERDLLWIRDEFLLHGDAYEKVIVHGHSITPAPEFKTNRIGIDTGAFYSNKLTCLVLDGKNKDIL
ncbi:MAG: metallophosphoesterase [Sneathiella sp.]|nr:MAG: metallophosphoesterase [Sneathiella sp.]